MIIVLKRGTEPAQVAEVMQAAERRGLRCVALTAGDKPILHVTRGETRRARKLLALERVQALVATSGPRVRSQGRRFYPYHFLNWCTATLMLLATIVLLAGLFPPGLGPAPDPRVPPGPPVSPWWSSWIVRAFSGTPSFALPLALFGGLALLLALPSIERALFGHKEDA